MSKMQTMTRPICVVKLGGSLFDLPDLPIRLKRMLRSHVSDQQVCVIPGGGRFADEIRRLDAVHMWSADRSHRLAIQAMGLSARMIAAMVTGFELSTTLAGAAAAGRCVLDLSTVPDLDELPPTWDITSDSIAAWVAIRLKAAQLMLLKSFDLGEPLPTLEAASHTGWVDLGLMQYGTSLPLISWVNMRAPVPEPVVWLRGGEISSS